MIKLAIQGISDGRHEINKEVPVSEVEGMFPEFFGSINLSGILRKIGKRYSFVGTAECMARLICDITLREYEELISADIKVSFLADTALFRIRNENEDEAGSGEENVIHEEDKHLDLTEEIREQLAVSLPMKRISPEAEGKDIDELYPDIAKNDNSEGDEDDIEDERWAPLKKIKLN